MWTSAFLIQSPQATRYPEPDLTSPGNTHALLGLQSAWSVYVPLVQNPQLRKRWRSSKSRTRAFNNHQPGAPQQTRVDKQMSNPDFNDAAAKVILSGHIDALEKHRRVLD